MALSCCTVGALAAEPAGNGISAPPQASIWARSVARVTDGEAWQGPGTWRIAASPYTHHWRYSEEHKDVYALGLERQCDDGWLVGGSFFRNSFGQPSGYVYLGARVEGLLNQPELFFQWSAGVIYGYKGKYKTKVPLNYGGFAPGALVTLGWQLNKQVSVAVHALGDAGAMFQLAYDLN